MLRCRCSIVKVGSLQGGKGNDCSQVRVLKCSVGTERCAGLVGGSALFTEPCAGLVEGSVLFQ